HLTALDEQVAENFNQHQLCGISNWQVGVAEDVAGLNCGDKQIPALQLRVFDRLRAEGDTIRMSRPSSEFNGSSEELRPRELDTSVFHAK
ncbi:MAG: hypothetical protein NTX25_20190, partial [Proteobacteria bacterium]|nr:hypothetical protein [Pseudomonadota bacterium]